MARAAWAAWAGIALCGAVAAEDSRFDAVYEPSGVTALPDGTVVVLDDEATSPLHRVRIQPASGGPDLVEQQALRPAGFTLRWRLGELDDLEGACADAAGRVYAIGSHNVQSGIDDTARRKVVRLQIDAERITDFSLRRDLRQDLLQALPRLQVAMKDGGKHGDDLDIEALACDRRRDRLLIGLRSPLEDDHALVVAIDNADDWIEGRAEPQFTEGLRRLDLDRGGIRAMGYDDAMDALVVVSQRESGKARYKAWFQDAAFERSPLRLKLDDKKAFDDVEGVTVLPEPNGVLFVRDDGDRDKRDPGAWFIVDRSTLGLPED